MSVRCPSLRVCPSPVSSFFHVDSARGKHPQRFRLMRSIAPWRYTILPLTCSCCWAGSRLVGRVSTSIPDAKDIVCASTLPQTRGTMPSPGRSRLLLWVGWTFHHHIGFLLENREATLRLRAVLIRSATSFPLSPMPPPLSRRPPTLWCRAFERVR